MVAFSMKDWLSSSIRTAILKGVGESHLRRKVVPVLPHAHPVKIGPIETTAFLARLFADRMGAATPTKFGRARYEEIDEGSFHRLGCSRARFVA